MSNIKNYKVILDEAGVFKAGALTLVDLFSADGTTSKVVSIGYFDTSVNPPVKVTKKTKPTDVQYTIITDTLTGLFFVVDEEVATVSADIEFACDFCNLDSASENALGASCATPMNTKDCDREALIEKLNDIYEAVDGLELTTENIRIEAGQINLNTDEVEQKLDNVVDTIKEVNTLVLDFKEVYCGTSNGVSKNYQIRQYSDYNTSTKVKTPRPLEYSEDGLIWTETAPANTTFVFGACNTLRRCNSSIQLDNQKVTFPANTIFTYEGTCAIGTAKHIEENTLTAITQGDSFGQQNTSNVKLENQVEIIAYGTSRVSFMGDCENPPIISTLSAPLGLSYNPNAIYFISSGMSFSPTLSSDGNDTVTYEITSGTLPTGVTLNPATGEISGIPTVKGSYTLTVQVCNLIGCTSATFTFETDYCKEDETIVIPANKGIKLAKTQVFAVDYISNNTNIEMTVGDLFSGVKTNFTSGNLPTDIADNGDFISDDIYLVNNGTGDLTIKVTKWCGQTLAIGTTLGGALILATINYNSVTEVATLNWTDVTAEIGYKVFKYKTADGISTAVEIGNVGADVTTLNHIITVFNEEFSFYVVAYNVVDIAESNTLTLTPWKSSFIFSVNIP